MRNSDWLPVPLGNNVPCPECNTAPMVSHAATGGVAAWLLFRCEESKRGCGRMWFAVPAEDGILEGGFIRELPAALFNKLCGLAGHIVPSPLSQDEAIRAVGAPPPPL